MDPIAYRFVVTQHDGMRLTFERTTSVSSKLNIWEGTELLPPHLHTPHRSNVTVTALAAIRYARKILSKYSTDRRHEPPARSASHVFGKTVNSKTYRVCLRCLTEQQQHFLFMGTSHLGQSSQCVGLCLSRQPSTIPIAGFHQSKQVPSHMR